MVDGEWISEVIDDKLYLIKENFDEAKLERYHWLELQNRKSPEEEYRTVMQTGSRALYFAQCSDPNETWLPLLEKAFAKAHGDYSSIDGGFVGEGIEDLTGGVTSEIFATDILDKEKFWREELMNVNKTFLFGCGQMDGVYGERRGIQEKHAYSIMEAREIDGQRLLKLRNPWGRTEWTGRWSDGSEEWTPEWMQKLNHKFGDDGVFWISYQDLLRSYQHFDRTRLFGPEWTVSQQWTSVNVPWSVDYLDTKFEIHLAQSGPVVIVLSQLDDRYYQGLEGQYEFNLQFRLHKDDEDDYIVRSNGTYYMKRSVSTELELEAGNYTVLLKIKATRIPENMTPDEVIRTTCTKRREKLLSIGLSYDLAHAKGQFRAQEKEKAEQQKQNKINRKKAEMKQSHERRKKLRKMAELREQKKAAKETRRMNQSGDARDFATELQSLSGLGISEEAETLVPIEESKPVHPAVSKHNRASSTGAIRDRSSSPGGGYGGRGGYNAALPGAFQGRGGYNRDLSGSAMAEALSHRAANNLSPLTSPSAHSQGFTGRGGYNQNMPGELRGRGGYNQNMPGELQGRGGYNQNMPGELQGRGGYNQNMPGELQGRGGYNGDLPGNYQGRDGYNEGQGTDSPIPTPLTDEFRPGTPSQRPYSPRPEKRASSHSRRPTLTPIPGVRPGIQLVSHRGRSQCSHRAQNGIHHHHHAAMSDDSSWDSELDGPNSLDSGLSDDDDRPRLVPERHPRYMWHNGTRYPYFEDEDEFERDPWNAVCVVGLRVFSKDNTDVTIEVVNGDSERKKKDDADDGSIISAGNGRRKEKTLDVDDSAADATSPLRRRNTGLDDELKSRMKEQELVDNVGTAPAGQEVNRQGTLS